jgi:putative aminopeptidase FrvX
MAQFEIAGDYLIRVLEDLINTPSPTGDTDWAIGLIENELEEMGLPSRRTRKGALVSYFEGFSDDAPRALTAHVDTLGAMVAEIKSNGRLRLKALNGVNWPTVESEGVTISTLGGQQWTGSIVLENGAAHVNREAATAARNADTLEVRIDEPTTSADETRMLGIQVGDFVSFDPRFVHSRSGFVRSRFLDDKACVACMLAGIKAVVDAHVTPSQRTYMLASVHEEVGHGGADGLPEKLAEMVVLDMAVVGKGQNGSEHHCSICTADSGGPYSKGLTNKLRLIAEKAGIELRPDVYPHYSSDGTAYWHTGGGAQVALIGPGVDTSHGYERTHMDALIATAQLVADYLVED